MTRAKVGSQAMERANQINPMYREERGQKELCVTQCGEVFYGVLWL